MRQKFDRRFWILICCYLTSLCILSDLHLLCKISGQNIFVLADTNHKKTFENHEMDELFLPDDVNSYLGRQNNLKNNDDTDDDEDENAAVVAANNLDGMDYVLETYPNVKREHFKSDRNGASDYKIKLNNDDIKSNHQNCSENNVSNITDCEKLKQILKVKETKTVEDLEHNSKSTIKVSRNSFKEKVRQRRSTTLTSNLKENSSSSVEFSQLFHNQKQNKQQTKTLPLSTEPSLSASGNKINPNLNSNKKSDTQRNSVGKAQSDSSVSVNRTNTDLSSVVNEIEDQIRANPSLSEDQIIIITNDEVEAGDDKLRNVDGFLSDEPKALPLRPIIRGPDEDGHQGEMSIVYAEQHTSVKLNCEVDLDISTSVWFKDGQMVHATEKSSRPTEYRFVREPRGGLTISNVMLEDDGKWQCEAENARGYVENARPTNLIVLDRPKPPYLLIDSRRLDAGNIFVPVKENSELSLACVSEGGNPKPTLTWEVLLSPGVDRHAQKVAAEVLELQEVKSDKDKEPYKINSGAISEAKLPAVYRAHHNARILCIMEHPTLKMRLNASLLLDVQYTPSFAISRTPGFGYPLREGIEVSLKCDVDSNPPSTPVWQKDDSETPVPQSGDGYLNFTSIRREHSGWYKCTSRHLNFQYSSIGYYLSIRYDSVDVTSEPGEQDIPMASHNPYKGGQIEVELGGTVTLQCPQGSLGCWSHLDPITARLKGLGVGLSTPTGQFSLKDVVYQDAGTYKCIGQSAANKKKLEVLQSVGVAVKGQPVVVARNSTGYKAYPGSPLHLSVEFCANPPAFAARWLHGDRVYTPGNQYGIDVLAYGVIDLPTPFCKEARLTYVHMHERVPRTFYFVVSSPGGVAEAIFRVNFTLKHKTMSNSVDEEEELSEPEEIHFPVFGSSCAKSKCNFALFTLLTYFICIFNVL